MNHQLEQVNEFFFHDRVIHILNLSEDKFLVILETEIHFTDNQALLSEQIELEQLPNRIFSGTILGENRIFLHVKSEENLEEGRVYNLKGMLISKIEVMVIFQ